MKLLQPSAVVRCLFVFFFFYPAISAFAASAVDINGLKALYKRPDKIPFPSDNPYTQEKATLGKMLFFDARLSRDQNFTCASCHNPSFGWEVPLPKAIGAGNKPLPRSAPTVQNHAWSKSMFWDGREPTLEAQARRPIEAKLEMDVPLSVVVQRLKNISTYNNAFSQAFSGEGITENNILKAIATYERTIVSPKSPFDDWIDGDEKAISEDAKAGFVLFNTKARCVTCHTGWNFTDDKFHDIGLSTTDIGRGGVTNNSADNFAMKTPSLRDAVRRAPFMHNGSLTSLKEVMAHYASGGVNRPSKSSLMQPLQLSNLEVQQLIAFIRTLNSKKVEVVLPAIPAN